MAAEFNCTSRHEPVLGVSGYQAFLATCLLSDGILDQPGRKPWVAAESVKAHSH